MSKVSNSSDKIILAPPKFMCKLKKRKNKNSNKVKINKCTQHSENEIESCKLKIHENKNNISLKNSENTQNKLLRKETDFSNFECINSASCLSTNKHKTFENIKSLYTLLSISNNLLNRSFDQMLKNLNILMIIINYYEKSKCK